MGIDAPNIPGAVAVRYQGPAIFLWRRVYPASLIHYKLGRTAGKYFNRSRTGCTCTSTRKLFVEAATVAASSRLTATTRRAAIDASALWQA